MQLIIKLVFMISIVAMCCGSARSGTLSVKQISGQAGLGTVEIHGVGAGEFAPKLWESGKMNLIQDIRQPLLAPRLKGMYRNIYAPSVVRVEEGWRVFYGGWDGSLTGNDRIYSVDTADFIDFADRKLQIDHGDFIHCCNVSALRLPGGDYRLTCTVYPDEQDRNKPAAFFGKDGEHWNLSGSTYAAKLSDIIDIQGYARYKDADINGMNVILYEDNLYRLYFNNFKDFGKVYRASSTDGKNYTFDGVAVSFDACVNDVKKFTVKGQNTYLMGLHLNKDSLYYTLSGDGLRFAEPKLLSKNSGEKDRYMVAIGWVVDKDRLLGYLYGAGEVPTLDRNRIWAKWLQKKVVFVAEDGTRYVGSGAIGPDRQIINVPTDKTISGKFEIYAEDGNTLLATSGTATVVSGAVFAVK